MHVKLTLAILLAAWLSFPVVVAAQSKVQSGVVDLLAAGDAAKVIVILRPDPTREDGGVALSNATGYLSTQLGEDAQNVRPIGRWPIVSLEVSRQGLISLENDPNVALVVPDVPVPPILFDSVPLIGADKFHKGGIDGSKTSVAVLDTGVQPDHPSLDGSVVAEACFSTSVSTAYDVSSLCGNRLDVDLTAGAAAGCPATIPSCFHGTHVSGIVAGHQLSVAGHADFPGVAPGAKIVAIQVFTQFNNSADCGGRPAPCVLSFTSDQLRALDWVYRKRDDYAIAAVNMSLGGGYYPEACDMRSPLTEVIERLRAEGVITVIAAGNDAFFDGVSSPGCISKAFTVAATRKDGSLDTRYTNMSPGVDIAAPGSAIVSATIGSGTVQASGTSMAAPHVAAMVALLRQLHPKASALEIETILRDSGRTVTDPRTGASVVLAFLNDSQLPTGEATEPTFDWATSFGGENTGQFILRTDGSAFELSRALDDCAFCTLARPIGEGQVLVELAPSWRPAPGMTAGDELRNFLGRDVQVFTNDIVPPLGFDMQAPQ